jgi:hypothetical protein
VKNINVIMHNTTEEASRQEIEKATTNTYRKAVVKLLDQSGLTLAQKKELLDRIIEEGSMKKQP